MFKDTGIGALVFYVADLERTATFYRTVLGLDPRTIPGHDGPFLMAQTGSTTLVFFRSEDKPGRSPIVVFTLPGGGIDDVAEQLARHGVEFLFPVSQAPDGGLSTDFFDPDRHVLSIYQPIHVPRRRTGAP